MNRALRMQNSNANSNSNQRDEVQVPFNAEDERAILGTLILDFRLLSTCRRMTLEPRDFFVDSYRLVYEAMIAHQDSHVEECDPISLCRYLKEGGNLDRVGGPAAIGLLFDGIARFGNQHTFEAHIRAVKESARRRLLMRHANKTLAEISDGERGSQELATDLRRLAEDVCAETDEPSPTTSHLASTARLRMENRRDNPQRALRCGFDGMDSLLGGIRPGHLCVVAARSRVGKTTFALQWILQMIRDQWRPLLISLEMSSEDVMDRLLMLAGWINGGRYLSGLLRDEEWVRFGSAESLLKGSGLNIRDRVPSRLDAVTAETRSIQGNSGVDVLVLDYLGLLVGKGENRVAELSEITRGLKLFARDAEIPIIALAQLNRAIESRGKDKPRLSDIRESGSIEQDADQVIFITRDMDTEEEITEATLILEKNRHGRSGKSTIGYDKRIGGFGQ